LLADILPTLIIKLTAPFYMHKLSYNLRIILVIVFAVISFYIASFAPEASFKLFGVIMASISAGFGEITYLAMTSYYHKNAISAWSSGTGMAGLGGSLSYLLLTTFIKLRPQVALIICSFVPIAMAFAYFGLMSKPHMEINKSSTKPKTNDMTFKEKIAHIRPLLRYMIPLIIVYFSEYLINSGILPVIYYDEMGLTRSDVFRIYNFIYQAGVFISRSSVNYFPVKRIWLLPIWQVINMIFLLIEGYYQFLPSIWLVWLVVAWEGLLGGGTYVNAFYLMTIEVNPQYLEYCLGIASVADSFGITFAGISAIWVEAGLKRHLGQ